MLSEAFEVRELPHNPLPTGASWLCNPRAFQTGSTYVAIHFDANTAAGKPITTIAKKATPSIFSLIVITLSSTAFRPPFIRGLMQFV
jgi:hypothetical protein